MSEPLIAAPERILIADDDSVARMVVSRAVTRQGFQVIEARDGGEARAALEVADPPLLILLDWMMPVATGVELTRWIRTQPHLSLAYVALVTGNDQLQDIITGLEAGADDFVTKPVREGELVARLRAGQRVLDLKRSLATKVSDLETALTEVRTLRGLIPICMHCHQIRSHGQAWEKLESYLEANSSASFSHSICEACLELHYPVEGSDAA